MARTPGSAGGGWDFGRITPHPLPSSHPTLALRCPAPHTGVAPHPSPWAPAEGDPSLREGARHPGASAESIPDPEPDSASDPRLVPRRPSPYRPRPPACPRPGADPLPGPQRAPSGAAAPPEPPPRRRRRRSPHALRPQRAPRLTSDPPTPESPAAHGTGRSSRYALADGLNPHAAAAAAAACPGLGSAHGPARPPPGSAGVSGWVENRPPSGRPPPPRPSFTPAEERGGRPRHRHTPSLTAGRRPRPEGLPGARPPPGGGGGGGGGIAEPGRRKPGGCGGDGTRVGLRCPGGEAVTVPASRHLPGEGEGAAPQRP